MDVSVLQRSVHLMVGPVEIQEQDPEAQLRSAAADGLIKLFMKDISVV